MIPLDFSCNIKRKLVKLTVIIFLGLNPTFFSFSNPVVPGPMILEIYFSPEGWQIEMMNVNAGIENLDNVWMVAESDSAQFLDGIAFSPWEVIVVTQEDFMSELTINQSGDGLTLIYIDGEETYPIDYYYLVWGAYYVSAPAGEQSIALQKFEYTYYDEYWAVKEIPNTIGASPFEVSKRAVFSGYVRDKNNEPLADVEVRYDDHFAGYIFTDTNGHFTGGYMFCRYFHIYFIYNGGQIGDTTVSIEPDSANYFEFRLDTLLTAISENNLPVSGFSIQNIPNPSNYQTTFLVGSDLPGLHREGVIKIYSEAGYIVDIIPIEITGDKQEVVYNFNDKSLESGLYLYNLEIKNHRVASGKMIISR